MGELAAETRAIAAAVETGGRDCREACDRVRTRLGALQGSEDEWQAAARATDAARLAVALYDAASRLLGASVAALDPLAHRLRPRGAPDAAAGEHTGAALALRAGAMAGLALQRMHAALPPGRTKNTALDILKQRYRLLALAADCRLVCRSQNFTTRDTSSCPPHLRHLFSLFGRGKTHQFQEVCETNVVRDLRLGLRGCAGVRCDAGGTCCVPTGGADEACVRLGTAVAFRAAQCRLRAGGLTRALAQQLWHELVPWAEALRAHDAAAARRFLVTALTDVQELAAPALLQPQPQPQPGAGAGADTAALMDCVSVSFRVLFVAEGRAPAPFYAACVRCSLLARTAADREATCAVYTVAAKTARALGVFPVPTGPGTDAAYNAEFVDWALRLAASFRGVRASSALAQTVVAAALEHARACAAAEAAAAPTAGLLHTVLAALVAAEHGAARAAPHMARAVPLLQAPGALQALSYSALYRLATSIEHLRAAVRQQWAPFQRSSDGNGSTATATDVGADALAAFGQLMLVFCAAVDDGAARDAQGLHTEISSRPRFVPLRACRLDALQLALQALLHAHAPAAPVLRAMDGCYAARATLVPHDQRRLASLYYQAGVAEYRAQAYAAAVEPLRRATALLEALESNSSGTADDSNNKDGSGAARAKKIELLAVCEERAGDCDSALGSLVRCVGAEWAGTHAVRDEVLQRFCHAVFAHRADSADAWLARIVTGSEDSDKGSDKESDAACAVAVARGLLRIVRHSFVTPEHCCAVVDAAVARVRAEAGTETQLAWLLLVRARCEPYLVGRGDGHSVQAAVELAQQAHALVAAVPRARHMRGRAAMWQAVLRAHAQHGAAAVGDDVKELPEALVRECTDARDDAARLLREAADCWSSEETGEWGWDTVFYDVRTALECAQYHDDVDAVGGLRAVLRTALDTARATGRVLTLTETVDAAVAFVAVAKQSLACGDAACAAESVRAATALADEAEHLVQPPQQQQQQGGGGSSTLQTRAVRHLRALCLAVGLRTAVQRTEQGHGDSDSDGNTAPVDLRECERTYEEEYQVDSASLWSDHVVAAELEEALAHALAARGELGYALFLQTRAVTHWHAAGAVVVPGVLTPDTTTGNSTSGSSSSSSTETAPAAAALAQCNAFGVADHVALFSQAAVVAGAAHALRHAAHLEELCESVQDAQCYLKRALRVARRLRHAAWAAALYQELGELAYRRGDTAGKDAAYLANAQRLLGPHNSDSSSRALCQMRLGDVARRAGDVERARALYAAALDECARAVEAAPRATRRPSLVASDCTPREARAHALARRADGGGVKAAGTTVLLDGRAAWESLAARVEGKVAGLDADAGQLDAARRTLETALGRTTSRPVRCALLARLARVELAACPEAPAAAAAEAAREAQRLAAETGIPALLRETGVLLLECDADCDRAYVLNSCLGVGVCQQAFLREQHTTGYTTTTTTAAAGAAASARRMDALDFSDELAETSGTTTPTTTTTPPTSPEAQARAKGTTMVGQLDGQSRLLFLMHRAENRRHFAARYVDCLPPHWVVVSVVHAAATGALWVARLQARRAPLVVRLAGRAGAWTALCARFAALQAENRRTAATTATTDAERTAWWSARAALDAAMRQLLLDVETDVLGWERLLLLGTCADDALRLALEARAAALLRRHRAVFRAGATEQLLELVLSAYPVLDHAALARCCATLAADASTATATAVADLVAQGYRDAARDSFHLFSSSSSSTSASGSATATATGTGTSEEPGGRDIVAWGRDCARHPVVLVLDEGLQAVPWECVPCLAGGAVTRLPALAFAAALADGARGSAVFREGVHAHRGYYVVDPEQNLPRTAAALAPLLRRHGWRGVLSAAPPAPAALCRELAVADVLLYCGHGSGEQFVSGRDALALTRRCPAVLLMGCSSVALRPRGAYHATGAALLWLCAGAPCVVGNLWDVTDGDLDLLTHELFRVWLEHGSGNSSSGSGAAATTLPEALARARRACKFRHLVGAAAVCYGVPVCAATGTTSTTTGAPVPATARRARPAAENRPAPRTIVRRAPLSKRL